MPFLLLSFTASFPHSGSLQPLFLLPRILFLSQDTLGHPLGFALSHPRGSSRFPLSPCARLAHAHRWSLVTIAFPILGISYLCLASLFPLVSWGEGKHQGARPAIWGSQGDVG